MDFCLSCHAACFLVGTRLSCSKNKIAESILFLTDEVWFLDFWQMARAILAWSVLDVKLFGMLMAGMHTFYWQEELNYVQSLKSYSQVTVWRLVGVYCIQEKFLVLIFSFSIMNSGKRSSYSEIKEKK